MQHKMVQADRLAVAVGTLAAGIAHEINNPLAYVLLGLQYLERELPKLATEPTRIGDALERLAEVRNGAERVGTIVRDLKTFARADEVKRGPVGRYPARVREAALKIVRTTRSATARTRLASGDYRRVLPVDGRNGRPSRAGVSESIGQRRARGVRTGPRLRAKCAFRSGATRTASSSSKSPTMARGSPERSLADTCSIPSSPRSRSAWGPGSGCRSARASSSPSGGDDRAREPAGAYDRPGDVAGLRERRRRAPAEGRDPAPVPARLAQGTPRTASGVSQRVAARSPYPNPHRRRRAARDDAPPSNAVGGARRPRSRRAGRKRCTCSELTPSTPSSVTS